MAKSLKTTGTKGMQRGKDRKARGRTNITDVDPFAPTKRPVPQVARREASRPIAAGSGKHRGDRRDTSRTYTTNVKHAARGNNPRPDVKTRKR